MKSSQHAEDACMSMMVADLEGRVEDSGEVRFLRAEWWVPDPSFVVVRYCLGNGHAPALGVRVDLEKRAALDRFDGEASSTLQSRIDDIVAVVAAERRRAPQPAG
jgi:hypothetical protein